MSGRTRSAENLSLNVNATCLEQAETSPSHASVLLRLLLSVGALLAKQGLGSPYEKECGWVLARTGTEMWLKVFRALRLQASSKGSEWPLRSLVHT